MRQMVEETIKNMPNYFADYDTTVHFISEEELKEKHSGIPHGGFVIRSGNTGWNKENQHVIEYSLKLDSNPGIYFLRYRGLRKSGIPSV